MATVQDVIGDYTPLSNNVVRKLKLVRGAIVCKIFFTSNLEDRVCRMGQTRIAKELGLEVSTVSKGLKWLVDKKYIEQTKEHTPTEPAHYRCTKRFYQLAKGIDLINPTIDVINTPIDLINQEEELKEELKENKSKTDFLEHIVTLTGKVNEDSATNPEDQWFEYSNKLIKDYTTRRGGYPNADEKKALSDLAAEPEFDFSIWDRAFTQSSLNWSGNGKVPLARIIEVYRVDGDYKRWQNQTYPQSGKQTGPNIQTINGRTTLVIS